MALPGDRARRRCCRAGRVARVLDWRRPYSRTATHVRRPRVARLTQGTATSAGGLVIRYADGLPQLVAGRRRRDRDGVTWTLPKGTPRLGETTEETALREVEEETGLKVEIIGPAGSIAYSFVQRATKIHKTVHYFVMRATGGDLDRHDHEFDEVRWVDIAEARDLLTFESERALVARTAASLEAPKP